MPAQRAEDRHADVVEGLAQQRLVPGGGDPVEDHAAEPELLVVRPEAVHQRGHRLPHRGHVDHQHDRAAQRGGDRRGGLGFGRPATQSYSPMVPCDHREPGAGGAVREERGDPLRADQPGVEVAAGAAGGEPQVRRVDVVRADLETGDVEHPGRPARRAGRRETAVLPCPEEGALSTTRGTAVIIDSSRRRASRVVRRDDTESAIRRRDHTRPDRPAAAADRPVRAGTAQWPRSYG